MGKYILFIAIISTNLFGGYIGKGGLYDYKYYFASNDGGSIYRIYCVEKNSLFSVSKHRVFKELNGKWYDTLMDMNNPKYMGMTYDGLSVKAFGERVCK
jgi:hypothetical protein